MGRHRGPDVPAVTPRFPWLLRPLAGAAVALPVAALGMLWHGTWESTAQADELPQPPKVTQPAEVAGPVQPIFDFADVQPWDPGKEPVAVVVSQPVRTSRSAARVAAASVPRQRTQTVAPVLGDPPTPDAPQNDAEPVEPRDDPLTDDGTFGDGCEHPGTPPRCDPAPVGLPPVVVVEQPPVVVDEEPPAVPAEEEPPVDEVEVVEPTEEAAP